MKATFRRLNNSRWLLPTIQAAAVFIVGIVGGKLFEAWMNSIVDTPTKVVLAGVLTVNLVSVVILIVVVLFSRSAEKREEAWLGSFGVPAEIVFERASASEGIVYQRLIEFVNNASGDDQILIMTQHGESLPIDVGSTQQTRQRVEYCEALLRKAREKNIEYRRIVSFQGTSNDLDSAMASVFPWLLDHFRSMLELKKTKPDKISLKVSRKTIGADIFVVPRKVGAIVIDVYDPNTGVTTTNSSLFFHNPPNKQVIDQLRSWFKENEDDPLTRAIESLPVVH